MAMMLALLCLLWGRKTYVMESPHGNMFLKVVGCVVVSKKVHFKSSVDLDDNRR